MPTHMLFTVKLPETSVVKWHSTFAADGLRFHAAASTAALSCDLVDVVMQPVIATMLLALPQCL